MERIHAPTENNRKTPLHSAGFSLNGNTVDALLNHEAVLNPSIVFSSGAGTRGNPTVTIQEVSRVKERQNGDHP